MRSACCTLAFLAATAAVASLGQPPPPAKILAVDIDSVVHPITVEIVAHAIQQADGLLTCDAGFFRHYFEGLVVVTPEASL